MRADPLVTVIVPGWDVAAYAAEAVDSLRAQTDSRWRGILVDDGSVDGTGEIFDVAAAADERLSVIHHATPLGLGVGRNHALDQVRTTYVGFLDADDVMHPRALEHMLGTLESTGSDIVVGAYRRLRLDGDTWRTGEVQPWVQESTVPARRRVSLAEHPDVVGNIVAWSKVSRLSLWTRTGIRFPEGVLYEDQVATQQLYVAADGIDTIEEVVVDWRIRADGGSITQREADLTVLGDCLNQMRAGLAVLAAASPAAAARRTTQILRMDLPRLATVTTGTAEGRALVAEFARMLQPTAADLAARTRSPADPYAADAPTVSAVLEMVLGA